MQGMGNSLPLAGHRDIGGLATKRTSRTYRLGRAGDSCNRTSHHRKACNRTSHHRNACNGTSHHRNACNGTSHQGDACNGTSHHSLQQDLASHQGNACNRTSHHTRGTPAPGSRISGGACNRAATTLPTSEWAFLNRDSWVEDASLLCQPSLRTTETTSFFVIMFSEHIWCCTKSLFIFAPVVASQYPDRLTIPGTCLILTNKLPNPFHFPKLWDIS